MERELTYEEIVFGHTIFDADEMQLKSIKEMEEILASEEFECYSVNVDQDIFAKQKGSYATYTPNMPEEAKVWERR